MGVRGKDNAKCWEVDGKYAPGRQVDRSLGRYHFGVAIQSQKVTRVRDNSYQPWVILDGLKRNMSRGNSLSDELELSSVLGDTRAYLYGPVWG